MNHPNLINSLLNYFELGDFEMKLRQYIIKFHMSSISNDELNDDIINILNNKAINKEHEIINPKDRIIINDGVSVGIFGDAAVGESSIAERFTKNVFHDYQTPTIGAGFMSINTSAGYKIDFWDTAGQERYRGLANMYYRNRSVMILVGDITDTLTQKGMISWYKEIMTRGDKTIIINVFNKIDVVNDINQDHEFHEFIMSRILEDEMTTQPILLSAKSSKNIDELEIVLNLSCFLLRINNLLLSLGIRINARFRDKRIKSIIKLIDDDQKDNNPYRVIQSNDIRVKGVLLAKEEMRLRPPDISKNNDISTINGNNNDYKCSCIIL